MYYSISFLFHTSAEMSVATTERAPSAAATREQRPLPAPSSKTLKSSRVPPRSYMKFKKKCMQAYKEMYLRNAVCSILRAKEKDVTQRCEIHRLYDACSYLQLFQRDGGRILEPRAKASIRMDCALRLKPPTCKYHRASCLKAFTSFEEV